MVVMSVDWMAVLWADTKAHLRAAVKVATLVCSKAAELAETTVALWAESLGSLLVGWMVALSAVMLDILMVVG